MKRRGFLLGLFAAHVAPVVPAPVLANGGIVGTRLYTVGERGPETILAGGVGGGSGSKYVTIELHGVTAEQVGYGGRGAWPS